MPATLHLSPDELLTTTRAVRKRLDLKRPVPMPLIRECLEIALQAPSGGNTQGWHFLVVTDAAKRKKLGEFYKEAWDWYAAQPFFAGKVGQGDPKRAATQTRIADSAAYLADHLAEVPVHVIPCLEGRPGHDAVLPPLSRGGSLFPAVWSFMLAARARGLGTVLTSLHLKHEREAADLLGIPYEKVAQGGLVPVAFTQGTDFKPGARQPLDQVLHVDRW